MDVAVKYAAFAAINWNMDYNIYNESLLKVVKCLTQFIKGRTLSRQFYLEIIRPLLTDIPHDACLVGEGSDVLGYDQPISTDHVIRDNIITNLPAYFKGFPTRKDENISNIHVTTISKWLRDNLCIDKFKI